MKALIRKSNEIIIESDGIVGIDWDTGAPLTNMAWAGGPYTLVNDYVPKDLAGDLATDPTPAAQDPIHAGSTIVIDGVTYTRAP